MKELVCYGAVVWLLLFAGEVLGQSLDQAKQLYDQGHYEEAKPVFERLVKQAPANGTYNHWYGVCCYETGELEKALPYLEAGVKRKIQESYRYLAMLCFKTYRFEQAESLFGEYIALIGKRKQDTSVFIEWKDRAAKARQMLENVEWIQIIDSIVTGKDDFLHTYSLSKESGSILPANDVFTGTPAKDVFPVYVNRLGNKIFYAQQTDGHFRIYTQSRLIDSWGDEKLLPPIVNCGEDNSYPFVLPDGITLYYASTNGHSIGGYDLFVTRYNTSTNSYLAPQQLGMPFNSIYNDYFIVFDEFKKLGWFVSDRFQPEGKVCVYLFTIGTKIETPQEAATEEKRLRAMPFSISCTWADDTLYADLIQLAYETPPVEKDLIKKDFEFIVNHNLAYYTLDEIPCLEARNLYAKYLSMDKQVTELQSRLETLRAEYANGNVGAREHLRNTILQAEARFEVLSSQLPVLEKQARNAVLSVSAIRTK
ncbi:MAG: tetratricopeptide repeat protein [Tannerellaceae bacterium]|jgi:tetratricopeptide (TPR) repeat protein|nr:tetratricopeptide repeat protein [Tannerellaceae bacterium]